MTLAALDIFDPSSYPTRRDEDWKYSDLSRVLREAPRRFRGAPLKSPADSPNGWSVASQHINDAASLELDDALCYEPQSGAYYAEGRHWFHHDLPQNDELEGIQGDFPRASLKVAARKTLFLLETFRSEGAYVSQRNLDFVLEHDTTVVRVVLLDEHSSSTSIYNSRVQTAPGSVFKQYVFSTGAKFQRFETHVEHAGHGASVELHGAYLLKDKAHFDLTTRVNHAQPDGVTQQLIKGLVKDQATAVFQGRIKVERGADGTDARMRHQALMLNDGAHVRAKPELEIYADDVQCAHGNTIGAMDEAALFFCQSRGMDEATARQLLMQAFVTPVADQIEDEDLRAKVLEFLEKASEAFYAV